MTLPDALSSALAAGPLLLDGAIGSQLLAQGLPPGQAPEQWNLERPERVAAVHRAYAEAGSRIVHTNTFGASPPKLEQAGLEGQCGRICAAAARLARDAVGRGVWVAGDLGPSGMMLPPMGGASEDQLRDAFREQAEALAEADVDLLSIETMFDLREARAAVEAARFTGLPVLASMTFDRKPRGFFTLLGDRVDVALPALIAAGADAVGCNCTLGSAEMVDLVAAMAALVEAPILAQPNAGQPTVEAGVVAYSADPASFACDLVAMVERGAALVGGCCGTDPRFIASAREALAQRGGT